MHRLNNIYYSKYESTIESEAWYDSDNSEALEASDRSPFYEEFKQYIERRNDEELMHNAWKQRITEHVNLTNDIESLCGMKVYLANERVKYIYYPTLNEIPIPGFRFKITLVYIKLLRKWYISLGRCLLPDVINIQDKLNSGVYNPIGPKVLKLITKVKDLIDVYMRQYVEIQRFIDHAKENYKDIEVGMDIDMSNVRVVLKDKAWPEYMKHIDASEVLILSLAVDENITVNTLAYEYIHGKMHQEEKKQQIKILEDKLKLFFHFSLQEAIDKFMKADIVVESSESL